MKKILGNMVCGIGSFGKAVEKTGVGNASKTHCTFQNMALAGSLNCSEESKGLLRQKLKSMTWVVVNAIESLSRLRAVEAIPRLGRILRDEPSFAKDRGGRQAAAARALVSFGDRESMVYLIDRLVSHGDADGAGFSFSLSVTGEEGIRQICQRWGDLDPNARREVMTPVLRNAAVGCRTGGFRNRAFRPYPMIAHAFAINCGFCMPERFGAQGPEWPAGAAGFGR